MVFSSLNFLFLFLPICLLLYYCTNKIKTKNIILLILSLFFYAWGEPIWVILLIFSALVDYTNGIIIEKCTGKWQAKAALITSLVINLSMLGAFKYTGFFIENINTLFSASFHIPDFNLPIGISFYTFQTISYTIDVYRGKAKTQHSFLNFLLFVSLFPQLIAGPILRYTDISHQIDDRKTTFSGFAAGINRFIIGLSKKVLLANMAGQITASLLEKDLGSISVLGSWIGIFFYSMQIYFDFSGYSDMAIGLGYMFGFEYVENFNYPYISKSITEFWRRWHITLSSFFRDYVYIPLGGNRKYQIFNMFIVWILTGLWHGASWNFILWGLYYFVFLVIEKKIVGKYLEKLPSLFGHIYSLFIILIGWVFFYFDSTQNLFYMLKIMFGMSGQPSSLSTDHLALSNNLWLIVILVLACLPFSLCVKKCFSSLIKKNSITKKCLAVVIIIFDLLLMFISVAALVGASYNPFLYFRF